MAQIWDAFSQSYKTEGLTGAKTPSGGKAYAFETGYEIGSEIKISGFDIGYVRRRSGLEGNQQVLAVLTNLKFQRYFTNNGSLALYNTYDTQNARSRLLGKRIKQWIEREGLKVSDIPARASYQAANPAVKDTEEVLKYGGSESWVKKEGGEAKDLNISFPALPTLPSFSISATTKVIIAIVGGIILLALLLGSLGYSGLGGALGSRLEKEDKGEED